MRASQAFAFVTSDHLWSAEEQARYLSHLSDFEELKVLRRRSQGEARSALEEELAPDWESRPSAYQTWRNSISDPDAMRGISD